MTFGSRRSSRRTFLQAIGYAGAVVPMAMPRLVRAVSPSSRLNLAAVGCAGKGWQDLSSSSGGGKLHNVVALCDIDHRHGGIQPDNLSQGQRARPLGIGLASEVFPKAARFADFRRMFDTIKNIDAVTVSVPDHMHATIAMTAMSLGHHVYVQKPLAQTVHEVRAMHEMARKTKVITQMGNQGHTSIGHRCLVEVIQEGAIGKVREAHAWTSSPSWPQGIDRPKDQDPIPEGVHWDLWLGVSPPRPYKNFAYHNFNWRGWHEFGTGALGDMGCHILDPVTWALDLGQPKSIAAEISDSHEESYPASSVVRYEFAPTPYTTNDLFRVTWYDAGRKAPLELLQAPVGYRLPTNGSLFVGEKGVLVSSFFPSAPRLYPEDRFVEYSRTRLRELYKSFAPVDHYRNWTEGITSSTPAASNFEVAAPLAETVLLGTIAQRLPDRKLSWNAATMQFESDLEANALVRRSYRVGWGIEALS